MQELDDIALLREYVERNSETAFATLIMRHIDRVYSVALRHTRNPHQAEEITQAIFIILAQKSKSLRKGVILEGWLYQTARLTALTHIRSEIRRAHREQEAHMQTVLNENESEVWSQITPLLDAALSSLNETDRNAVVLRFFYGKSMKEIGTTFGANEDTARMRVHRAIEKLRTYFSKHGVTSTAAMIAGAISANSVQAAPVTLAKSVTVVAIAKGAAASASTLTLVKGALKIMAWTKMKTAIGVSVIVLAVGGSSIAVEKLEHKPQSSAAIAEAGVRRGLVLDYKFDRGIVGDQVTDASGAGNDGQIFGAQRISDPQRGNVLQFSPPNQYILVPNSASLNPSNLTLAAWIKTSNQGETWRRIFDKGWTDGFALSIVGGHKPGFTGDAEMEIGKTHVAHSNHSVADGRWHHVAVTYNGAEEIFYVDGVPQTRTSWWQGSVPSNSHNLTIGINLVDPNPQLNEVGASFDGLIDEPMLFNRALSPDEIKSLFNSQRK